MARSRRPELPDPIGDRLIDVTARPVDTFAAPAIRPPSLPSKSFEIGRALSSLAPSLSNFGEELMAGKREQDLAQGIAEASQYQELSGAQLAEIERKSRGVLPWRYQGILIGRAREAVNTAGKQQLMQLLDTDSSALDDEGNIRTFDSVQPKINEIFSGLNIAKNGFSQRAAQDAWGAAVSEFQQNWVQTNRRSVIEHNDRQVREVVIDALSNAPTGNLPQVYLDTVKQIGDAVHRVGLGEGQKMVFAASVQYIRSQLPFTKEEHEFEDLEALIGTLRSEPLIPGQEAALNETSQQLSEARNRSGIDNGERSQRKVDLAVAASLTQLQEAVQAMRDGGLISMTAEARAELVASVISGDLPVFTSLTDNERRRVIASLTLASRSTEDAVNKRPGDAVLVEDLLLRATRGEDVSRAALAAWEDQKIRKEHYDVIEAAVDSFASNRPGGGVGGRGSAPTINAELTTRFSVDSAGLTPRGRATLTERITEVTSDLERQLAASWRDIFQRVEGREERKNAFDEARRVAMAEAVSSLQQFIKTDLASSSTRQAVEVFENSRDGQTAMNALIDTMYGQNIEADAAGTIKRFVAPGDQAKAIPLLRSYLRDRASTFTGDPEDLQDYLYEGILRVQQMDTVDRANYLRRYMGPNAVYLPPAPRTEPLEGTKGLPSDAAQAVNALAENMRNIRPDTDRAVVQRVNEERDAVSTAAREAILRELQQTDFHIEVGGLPGPSNRYVQFTRQFASGMGTTRDLFARRNPTIQFNEQGLIVDRRTREIDPQRSNAFWAQVRISGTVHHSHLDTGYSTVDLDPTADPFVVPLNRTVINPTTTSMFRSREELAQAFQEYTESQTGPIQKIMEYYPSLAAMGYTPESLMGRQATLLRQQNPFVDPITGDPRDPSDQPYLPVHPAGPAGSRYPRSGIRFQMPDPVTVRNPPRALRERGRGAPGIEGRPLRVQPNSPGDSN